MQDKSKEDKQKVTLYLPQELHRQLKIRAAVDSETMTDIARRAIVFYLSHPDVVEQCSEGYGQSHRVYSCPECSTAVVLREGEMVPVQTDSNVLLDDNFALDKQSAHLDSQSEEELVPC